MAHFVKAFNNNIFPNMRVIKKCIETNREISGFLENLIGSTDVDVDVACTRSRRLLTLGDTIEDSFYFPNMVSQEETK